MLLVWSLSNYETAAIYLNYNRANYVLTQCMFVPNSTLSEKFNFLNTDLYPNVPLVPFFQNCFPLCINLWSCLVPNIILSFKNYLFLLLFFALEIVIYFVFL